MSATAHATDDTAVRFAVAITITIGGGRCPPPEGRSTSCCNALTGRAIDAEAI